MKLITTWFPFLLWQLLMFGGLAISRAYGIEAGANVAVFLAWFNAVFAIGCAFIVPKKRITPKGPVRRAVGRCATCALVLTFAALGYFALATFYALGGIATEIWREKFDEQGNPIPEAG